MITPPPITLNKKIRMKNKVEDMRFFIIDTGEDVQEYCKIVCESIEKDENHYLLYLSDQPNLFCVEEITEDDFFKHIKSTSNTITNG